MSRLSMNEVTTYRWSFEEDVAHYAAHGISAISVWRQKLADYGEEKGAELLNESGLRVASLSWAGGFTGSDGRSFRESVEDALEAVRLAAMLNSPCLVVHSGGRGGHTCKHARRLLLQALLEILPAAEQAAVRLAIEPMPVESAADWTFLTSIDEAVDLVNEVGPKQAGIVLDLYQWGWQRDLLGQVRPIVDNIALVQLSDGRGPPDCEQNRCLLGQGRVPLGEWLQALVSAGYDGDYEVELMGEEIEPSKYENVLQDSKRIFERLLAEAAV